MQSVKHVTLGFGSGCDLRVVRSSSGSGFVLSVDPACDSLSFPLLPPTHVCSLSPPHLKINKSFFFKVKLAPNHMSQQSDF